MTLHVIQHSPGFGKGFPSFVSFSSRYNFNDTDNIIMYKTTLDKRKGKEFYLSSVMILVFLTTVKRECESMKQIMMEGYRLDNRFVSGGRGREVG